MVNAHKRNCQCIWCCRGDCFTSSEEIIPAAACVVCNFGRPRRSHARPRFWGTRMQACHRRPAGQSTPSRSDGRRGIETYCTTGLSWRWSSRTLGTILRCRATTARLPRTREPDAQHWIPPRPPPVQPDHQLMCQRYSLSLYAVSLSNPATEAPVKRYHQRPSVPPVLYPKSCTA
jgi:hypothetical protein